MNEGIHAGTWGGVFQAEGTASAKAQDENVFEYVQR